MSENLVMSTDNLYDIMGRLTCFGSLLETIRLAMDDDDKMVDSMSSASDLLSCICRDFQADIDCSEYQAEKASRLPSDGERYG